MKCAALTIAVPLLLLGQNRGDGNLDTITLNNMPCSLEGTAKSQEVKDLNRLKGRYHMPVPFDFDESVTLTAMIAPGDDEDRFDDRRAARVIGFVLSVQVGGNETCNCKATNPDERDTHIALTASEMPMSDDAKKQSVVAEVTPRTRIVHQRQSNQNGWTTDALRAGIQGKWVEISGWLMFDFEHVHQAENTNPGGDGNWRATCWEIHPVTDIKVLDGPPSDDFRLSPSAVRAFQKAQAAHVNKVGTRRQFVAERNARLRSRIGEDEHDESNH
jgi:hypothetical protein